MGTRANFGPERECKNRTCREKNGEESSWIPACSKTVLFWIVSSPANYYFHWLRAVTHQSNVNRYLSQGRTSVRRDATLRCCHNINQNREDEVKFWEGVEFSKYTERKEGDYSKRRTREGRCRQGKTFWLYYRPVLEKVCFALASTDLRWGLPRPCRILLCTFVAKPAEEIVTVVFLYKFIYRCRYKNLSLTFL